MAGFFFFENPKQCRIDKGLSIDYDLNIHFDQLTVFSKIFTHYVLILECLFFRHFINSGGSIHMIWFMYNHHVEPWKWLKSYFKLFLKSDLGIKERFHMHTLIGFNHFVVQVIRMGLFLVLQSGNTPLHLAVTRGQLGTVKLLLGYRPIFSIPNLVSSRVCYLIFARVS